MHPREVLCALCPCACVPLTFERGLSSLSSLSAEALPSAPSGPHPGRPSHHHRRLVETIPAQPPKSCLNCPAAEEATVVGVATLTTIR
jgi:hypothetical protein